MLRRALEFDVEGQRQKGRLKRTCKKSVVEEGVKAGLSREDAFCWSRLSVSVNQMN